MSSPFGSNASRKGIRAVCAVPLHPYYGPKAEDKGPFKGLAPEVA